jgi:hypothetical protein
LHAGTRSLIGGMGIMAAHDVSDPDAVVIRGMARSERAAMHDDLEDVVHLDWKKQDNGLWAHPPLYRHNAFVRNGLNAVLERMFGIGTTAALSRIALSADAQTVVVGTTLIDPAGGASGSSFKTFSPAASVDASTSKATAGASFTQADVTWAVNKMGLANAATDAGVTTAGAISGVWDIIGGTGGSSPYNQAFSADYTGSTSFTLTPSIVVTAAAS